MTVPDKVGAAIASVGKREEPIVLTLTLHEDRQAVLVMPHDTSDEELFFILDSIIRGGRQLLAAQRRPQLVRVATMPPGLSS